MVERNLSPREHLKHSSPFVPSNEEMEYLRRNSSFSPRELMQFLLVADGTQPAYYEHMSMLLPNNYEELPVYTALLYNEEYLKHGFEYFQIPSFVDGFIEERDNNQFYHLKVFAAHDLDRLLDLRSADAQKDFGKIGLLLGYPHTAVDAFLEGDEYVLSEEELRENIKDPYIDRFMVFQLSKEHWKEELMEVQKRRDKVKELSPFLYEQIINEF